MAKAHTYKSVINHFNAAPERVRKYFPDFVDLVSNYDWEVPISYVFSRIEQAKRLTIYCGIVKLHWCDASLTWRLVNEDHMARGRFKDLFKIVFGRKIPDHLKIKLENGEKVRDKIAHGISWTPAEARDALVNVIDFASGFNEFVYKQAGFRPFGDLRGYKGRKEPLSKATTKWILRGMGIPKKNES